MIYSGYSCDNCGVAGEYNKSIDEWLPSKKWLIKFARENGWSVGKQILCPRCKKRRKE